jgi:TolB-like protein/Tfp pilus assembly protein PilF
LTESKNAVFLSYAAEDAIAAQRLCAALRGAGIEVWLDRSELRGGDAWDQKIRREIRDCALFIPIISANTQARLEGYFRREWKLAVARTLDMADDKAFLMPVVIDGTDDQDIHVPEKFRELQWTSLPGGETPTTFLERLRHLLFPAEGLISTPINSATGGRLSHGVHSTPAAHVRIPEKSIAVLPFADMSAQRDQEYFSDGLAEALIDLLMQVRDLRVPARTSSFSFKGKSDDIASIAHKLRVAHVLEGSVRKAGNTIRVTVHLIRADDGYHLWSKTYDGNIEDIFKVQDEIAGSVVEALKAQLLPAQGVINPHRTSNIEAYEQYLLGKQCHYYRRGDSPQRALTALTKALALDANYASAHALLAVSISDQIMEGTAAFQSNAPQAIDAAEKAVALAPGLGEAYSARSFVRSNLQWDWNGAQADIEMALQLDPRSETTQRRFGLLLASMGRIHEALAAAKAATEIEPLDVTSWSLLGLCYCAAGQFADGQRALKHGLGLSPGSIMMTLWLSLSELATGQTLEALQTNTRQQYEPWRWAILTAAEYTLGHTEESQKVMDEMINKYGKRTPYTIAIASVWRGQIDTAFEWLERAYQQHDAAIALLQAIFGISEVRKDPRYKELLRKMNFVDDRYL